MTDYKKFVAGIVPRMRRDSSGFILVRVTHGQWTGGQNVETNDGEFTQSDISEAVNKARASLTEKLNRADAQLASIEMVSRTIHGMPRPEPADQPIEAPDDFDAAPF